VKPESYVSQSSLVKGGGRSDAVSLSNWPEGLNRFMNLIIQYLHKISAVISPFIDAFCDLLSRVETHTSCVQSMWGRGLGGWGRAARSDAACAACAEPAEVSLPK